MRKQDSEAGPGERTGPAVWPWSHGPARHLWTASELQMKEAREEKSASADVHKEGRKTEGLIMFLR